MKCWDVVDKVREEEHRELTAMWWRWLEMASEGSEVRLYYGRRVCSNEVPDVSSHSL